MSLLQVSNIFCQSSCSRSLFLVQRSVNGPMCSSFWGKEVCVINEGSTDGKLGRIPRVGSGGRGYRVVAMSASTNPRFKMNLNEYMVTLEKPLGIRFALSLDGKILVHSMKKGGNAEKSRIIMVGDTLKKASASSGGSLIEIKDFSDAEKMMLEKSGLCSLVLERPFSPFPIQQLHHKSDLDIQFNRGRVPIATWNKSILTSSLQASSEGNGNPGFIVFTPRFSTPKGWNLLINQNGQPRGRIQKNIPDEPFTQLVTIFSDQESGDDWSHGSFPLEEYLKALDRSRGELYYDHALGMRYSKITDQMYVGSCIQTEEDIETLANVAGVTAILNFQGGNEAENWEIDSKSINESCQHNNILMINYPIRERDSFDLRSKLPFCVGLLLRLLKKNHCVYVTCTTGFDRSPTCVIAYLHWMTDTSLHAAYNYVSGLHTCRPDRPAIAWATWDLIAMVENGKHDGPATHSVTFVWNGHEGENVELIGDFSNWKEPIKATHKGGPRYEAEVRLAQGKYYYKFIVNGDWRHSTSSPTERDDRGNLNNILEVGGIANVRPSIPQPKKDANIVKVIERPLTENERFMLAKAARCIAFSVCPIRLAPK
ncbi:putative Dual specificity protein phosphatase [Helianthus annuus]|uniref:AMP-activated kinase, glycogen-binding protein n=1 Tax=Helianthus annuus TaxID=4232 RepID=A0A251SKQ6_HELAN|nr:phosphoglucan phosphatase LSF1, chloroplastic [Helianthus annuus]KAF5769954.1 putative AMP-activated kinase, glycogen-binding protein [Helianthus annuus]KAJ0464909.1 putative Dual specificity protein phosphatase [Helianthus annuus]KAJ0469604.1 putative Dual specificity protein phosphatase [Helianthus annuus]KAJ0486501.1 putative Dual specificity protein phosphatase [Helianthus annuus]KAJ0657067.1 putative Dual specificity protein phosphatase [Helianthus annuus]